MKRSLLISGADSLLLTGPSLSDVNSGSVQRPGPLSTQGQDAVDSGVIRIHAVAILADGSFATSRNRDSIGVRSATRLGTGIYEVLFSNNRLHRDCFWTGSTADRDPSSVPTGVLGLDARIGTNNGVFVSTYDVNGTAADRPFILTVLCAN